MSETRTQQDKDAMQRALSLVALRVPCRNISKLTRPLKPWTLKQGCTKFLT